VQRPRRGRDSRSAEVAAAQPGQPGQREGERKTGGVAELPRTIARWEEFTAGRDGGSAGR
jgi:hypothetical protein